MCGVVLEREGEFGFLIEREFCGEFLSLENFRGFIGVMVMISVFLVLEGGESGLRMLLIRLFFDLSGVVILGF